MNSKLLDLYIALKNKGISLESEQSIFTELKMHTSHEWSKKEIISADLRKSARIKSIYDYHDITQLQSSQSQKLNYTTNVNSLDELLERDRKREEDGFPRKVSIGRLIKPGKGGKDKIVIVPTTVEEKFIHDPSIRVPEDEGETGGSGDGEEGDIIGEQPVRVPEGAGSSAGEGEGGAHEMESSAYDLGKILTEKFELPNLKDKGKKRSLTRYIYDLTDKNRGYGQLIDKKATLKKIIETNISLDIISSENQIDPADLIVSPRDRIYRILSREKDYESQAIVFFLRDYSGSMVGKATDLIVSQHVMIYSWLLYQYSMQVETRFILHDTEAKEVPDFYTYYNSKVAGGTQVSSAYKLVNKIVDDENLAQDYNIYIFHGTDGDDWDSTGERSIPELRKMLTYANRIGVTVAKHPYNYSNPSEIERYLEKSGLLQEKPDYIRLDSMHEDADESRIIEGIKKLISNKNMQAK